MPPLKFELSLRKDAQMRKEICQIVKEQLGGLVKKEVSAYIKQVVANTIATRTEAVMEATMRAYIKQSDIVLIRSAVEKAVGNFTSETYERKVYKMVSDILKRDENTIENVVRKVLKGINIKIS